MYDQLKECWKAYTNKNIEGVKYSKETNGTKKCIEYTRIASKLATEAIISYEMKDGICHIKYHHMNKKSRAQGMDTLNFILDTRQTYYTLIVNFT